MITVKRNGYSVKIEGHADSAEYGKDLICASASILFYTLVENIDRLEKQGKCKATIKALEGDAEVRIIPHPDSTSEVLSIINTIMVGYEILEADYPENVKVVCG